MITSVNNVTGTNTASASASTNPGTQISSDFNAFLKMLTTQLQNQDPLNPMEGSDFAVQLATFSGVEQQAQTNKLLNQMIMQLGGSGLGQFADWIGKEVRTTEPVWFSDQPITLDIVSDTLADGVALVTLDAAGQEVSREQIGTGSGQVDWYGRDGAGDKLPEGRYSFRTESMFNGEIISTRAVAAYSRVTETEIGDEGAVLVLTGGVSVPANAVESLRAAR